MQASGLTLFYSLNAEVVLLHSLGGVSDHAQQQDHQMAAQSSCQRVRTILAVYVSLPCWTFHTSELSIRFGAGDTFQKIRMQTLLLSLAMS